MKKQIIQMLLFALLLVSVSVQAMNPAIKALGRIPKKRVHRGVKKPKERPYPVRPYPGSSFRPEPPAPITPIDFPQPIFQPEVKTEAKKEEAQRFQQISISPLPELKGLEKDVFVLDTSLVPRERLHNQMLDQYKKDIITILDKPVMDLVDEKIRLDPDWASVDDMRNLFVYFNNQVNALAQYVAQFAPGQCPQDDNYCNELIEQIKQLQKQLKIYLDALSKQLSL